MAIFNSFLYVYQRVSICIIYLLSKFHRGKFIGPSTASGLATETSSWTGAPKCVEPGTEPGTTGTMDGYGSHENYGWLVVYGNILLILMVNINGYHMVNDGFP